MQTAESCVLGSEQSSLEQSAPDEKVPELMYVLNLGSVSPPQIGLNI